MTHTIRKAFRAGALGLALALVSLTVPADAATAQITDGPDDAYRLPGTPLMASQPPNPILSDPKADIRSATFETVSAGRSYSVRMDIATAPDPAYNYIAAGEFGEDCEIFHFLTPATVTKANMFCGPGHERFVGSYTGSLVVVQGNSVTATFTYQTRRLPPELRADTELRSLFAFTCKSVGSSWACPDSATTLDYAEAPAATFRI